MASFTQSAMGDELDSSYDDEQRISIHHHKHMRADLKSVAWAEAFTATPIGHNLSVSSGKH
jgi:hypothetical protein